MLNLKDIGQPSEFWEYFEKVSKIPRCSEHEEKIRIFIKEESERLGFKSKIDSVGNLVVNIPAKSKKLKKSVLQCHLDMVCDKNESVIHDFSKDPLKLKVEEIKNEKWLIAEGTTLGADNGVGICYLLTLMKKIHKGELDFGSLGMDLLFTIDEEQGLRGAFAIDKEFLDGNFLINLDSEEDDAVTIGCAGGLVHFIEIKKETMDLNIQEEKLIPIKPDGAEDKSRTAIFLGHTQLMFPQGPVPLQAPLEADNLEQAMDAFPEAMKQALSEMAERIRKMQQQQQMQQRNDSQIIMPGR